MDDDPQIWIREQQGRLLQTLMSQCSKEPNPAEAARRLLQDLYQQRTELKGERLRKLTEAEAINIPSSAR